MKMMEEWRCFVMFQVEGCETDIEVKNLQIEIIIKEMDVVC